MTKNLILLLIVLLTILGSYHVNGDCITDPSTTDCVGYQYPEANATADINSLCTAMFYMPVCDLQQACQKASLTSGVCSAWSLLADSCTYDMPMMQGCKNFNSICSNTSVVKACKDYDSITGLPNTDVLNEQIFSICNEMSMEPCTQCPISTTVAPAYLKCDQLDVYTALCMSMPDMSQCSEWKEMCKSGSPLSESGISSDFCSKPNSEASPLMQMFFHTGILDYILFKSWVPRTTREFAGSWFAIFFAAVFFECMKTLRAILEKKWEPKPNSDSSDDLVKSSLLSGSYPPWSWRDIIRGFLHGLELTMSYLLMLVAMTFNVALFFAVIAGTIFGNIAVGRFRSYKPKVTCCD
ncbi:endosomal membrane protein [Tieghemostelium lacteum]|uniref:Copper transport protein n=1 Tax=Tieghemostelium lacteum TaxID=361077 RepID=A0A152A4R9_TIELA|nr:endosomal membrane protein [Tieghemostelium lacteum]|eukprot:KYR01229.1 endosomal membrane protein [Tieghemostelium lacteum]